MNHNLSLFDDFLEKDDTTQETLKISEIKINSLIAKRSENMNSLSQEVFSPQNTQNNTTTNKRNTNIQENMKKELETFSTDEILAKANEYFKGDDLAADVWMNKYALKDSDGNIYETTPDDMHHRMAKEFARIENNYPNPLNEDTIYQLFKNFKYIIPQGSPMIGIGNDFQISSLSNCFVIGCGSESDSYGGILKMDEEQVQLMKRRGGVGHDLSHIRPAGSPVKNCALTSTGVVPFMERYSNSTREVAQDGRRGALMLSISIKHPDAERFIDAKMSEGKITGANVSVRIDNEFMECVKNEKLYKQQYPIHSDNPKYVKEINARSLWEKIIYNAWKSAEPGILFWDTITSEAIPDCYPEHGFTTVSTNPCGEIPLCPYDSCRLIALNLYSYVENPFTSDAHFNINLFKEHVQKAQRLMDDIIDLELEKIDAIIKKINQDPESDDVKKVELELWEKIIAQTKKGRRTGLGITAEGDMLAALNLRYGTKEATEFSTEIHKQLALAAYRSSVTMAKERGAFPIYSPVNEASNPFINRIKQTDEKLYQDMIRYGRRNIALLTIAPTGTVSICTQTTSGIEPVFRIKYTRRRKINPNDQNTGKKVIKNTEGDMFEEYNMFHPAFLTWAKINGYEENWKTINDKNLEEIIEKSPYYKATAADIDWLQKVEMQGAIQKWVDHSISVTINLPENISESVVNDLYFKGWECGCKGLTVYRDGSRTGVLIDPNATPLIKETHNKPLKRPKELEAEIVRFRNNNESWIAFIGMYENSPYEIFTGRSEEDVMPIPKFVEKGKIIKNIDPEGNKQYDFSYYDKAGYECVIRGLSRCFNPEYWNYAKMISGLLRYHIPIINIVNIVSGLNFNENNINTWRNGVARALKKYIADGTHVKSTCPNCKQEDTLVYKEGCLTCQNCGYSKCG